MKKEFYVVSSVALLSIALFIVGTLAFKKREQSAQTEKEIQISAAQHKHVRDGALSLGPHMAKVVVVEFLDPECGSCRAFYPKVKELTKEFANVRFDFRYMPYHRNSLLAAQVIEFARGEDKGWQMLETLLERQPEWADRAEPQTELIMSYARSVGLDMNALQSAINSQKYVEIIKQDEKDGIEAGVKGTPTFFVNGRMLIEFGQEPLRKLILEEIAK
jgi:protein-disulfide isomerase